MTHFDEVHNINICIFRDSTFIRSENTVKASQEEVVLSLKLLPFSNHICITCCM